MTNSIHPAQLVLQALLSQMDNKNIDVESFNALVKVHPNQRTLNCNPYEMSIKDIALTANFGDFCVCENDGKLVAVPILGRMKV
jgi:hypothetical protein